MTGVEIVVLILLVIAAGLWVISRAVPNSGKAFEWSYGFLLAAVAVLAFGGHIIH